LPREPLTRCLPAAAILSLAAVIGVNGQLPLEPARESGQSVTPAYEGWFKNADGSIGLLLGYYNRNRSQTLDIPIGPGNRIEPGGPDQGQPTHFLTLRQWGVFAITVPAESNFTSGRTLTWTLTANGKTMSVPMTLNKDYEVEPLKDAAIGNTPPVLRFDPPGAKFQGPPRGIGVTLAAKAGQPLTIGAVISDDNAADPRRAPGDTPLSVSWSQYRGPGPIKFGTAKSAVGKAGGAVSTTATFDAPGDYIVRAQANDVTGDGGAGFQCCWTTALIKVTVERESSK
jgi:hypothetical protein